MMLALRWTQKNYNQLTEGLRGNQLVKRPKFNKQFLFFDDLFKSIFKQIYQTKTAWFQCQLKDCFPSVIINSIALGFGLFWMQQAIWIGRLELLEWACLWNVIYQMINQGNNHSIY